MQQIVKYDSRSLLRCLVLTAHGVKFCFVRLCRPLALRLSHRPATETAFAFRQFCPPESSILPVTLRRAKMTTPRCSLLRNRGQALARSNPRRRSHDAIENHVHLATVTGCFFCDGVKQTFRLPLSPSSIQILEPSFARLLSSVAACLSRAKQRPSTC